jgi:8-oxo-dGTP diphosphatase
MGCWNGIGGKLDPGESPRSSMIREIAEETGIADYRLHFKGIVTWDVDGIVTGGMYTYLAEVPESLPFKTPLMTREGILDWKAIGWILHKDNMGVASNIPKCLERVLDDAACYDHHCVYRSGRLTEHMSFPVSPAIEEDAAARSEYLSKYAPVK